MYSLHSNNDINCVSVRRYIYFMIFVLSVIVSHWYSILHDDTAIIAVLCDILVTSCIVVK